MRRSSPVTGNPDGRREEFLAAFDAFGERVRRVLARVCGLGHRDELDDLVQETFLRAWRGWDGFDGRASRSTWLVRIAIHAATDYLRRKRPEANAAEVERAAAPPVDGVAKTAVRDALLALSTELRATVVLFYFEEMSVAEVAAVLDVPVGTVKSRLAAAREKLAVRLGDDALPAVSGGTTDAA